MSCAIIEIKIGHSLYPHLCCMLYLSVAVIKSGEIYRSERPSSKGQYPSQCLILILPKNFICNRLHVRMNGFNMVYVTSTGI